MASTSLSKTKNIRKVYISDSPVAEDAVEYNYVSSDIDDDNGDASIKMTRPKDSPANMTSQPSLSEVDELAKEAEYQRELQDRLQKASIEDPTSRSVFL